MVNRDQLIAYLLHTMAEDERQVFSERWFAEPELLEALRMAEADLLDGYARGEVSGAKREQIERYLLASAGQRRKLDFAQALATTLPGARRPRNVNWATLGAVAAALVLAIALSLAIARNRGLEDKLAHIEAQARPRVQTPSLPGGVYALFLPGGALRSAAGIRVSLPGGTDVLHLELGLEPGQDREFDAAVVSISGHVLLKQQPVSVEGAASAARVSLWIPARLLGPGSYTVRLESGGTSIAYYSFTVLR
jgi:hypothetical protein